MGESETMNYLTQISSVCSLAILDQRENNAMNVLFPHTNHIFM